jgi:general secretion pathway protein G
MIVRSTRAARRVAFTLMEVLVVVAILVVLAGVGGVIYMRYLDEAKINAAKIGVRTLSDVCDHYKVSHSEYPPSLVILTQPEDGQSAILEQSALLDPWQHEYVYEPNTLNPLTGKPLVYSNGPSGGTPIRNWN